jgi:hypothetical protein
MCPSGLGFAGQFCSVRRDATSFQRTIPYFFYFSIHAATPLAGDRNARSLPPFDLRLVVQHSGQQRTMHFDLSVVADQAHFAEFVQEEADPGPGRADHLRQSKDWKLVFADNGIGKPDGNFAQTKSGLGTGIVSALASQLDAQVVTVSGPLGTIVSVTHSTFGSK